MLELLLSPEAWIAFATFPAGSALAGMAIIAGAGLLITLHERRRAQAVPTPPTGE